MKLDRREFLEVAGTVLASSAFPLGSFAAPPAKSLDNGKRIQTVGGPMPPSDFGFTSMHEHILLKSIPRNREEALEIWDEETLSGSILLTPPPVPENFFPEPGHPITIENRGYLRDYYSHGEKMFELGEQLLLAELRDFAKVGGRSILDVTVPHERGNPETIREMSEQTGVNIVMSTGLNSTDILPKRYKNMDVPELIKFMEGDLSEGIDDTDVKAGQIKLLVDAPDIGGEGAGGEYFRKGLEAAANISKNSGVSVTIHVYMFSDTDYRELLSTAKRFGAPPERVVLAHFQTSIREMRVEKLLKQPESFALMLDFGREVMDQGFTISFDTFGALWADTQLGAAADYDIYPLAAMYQYIQEGYADRIVIGTDLWTRISTRRYGGYGMIRLLNFVVPTLRKYGISQEHIDQITVHNPARLLAV